MKRDRGTSWPFSILVRRRIANFAKSMEAKLQLNDHKPHWVDEGFDVALSNFKAEVFEFLEALENKKSSKEILSEACDVALTAMMCVDIVEDIEKTGRP